MRLSSAERDLAAAYGTDGWITVAGAERIVRERMARAWDEGVTKASEYGGAFLRSHLAENPYRDPVDELRKLLTSPISEGGSDG